MTYCIPTYLFYAAPVEFVSEKDKRERVEKVKTWRRLILPELKIPLKTAVKLSRSNSRIREMDESRGDSDLSESEEEGGEEDITAHGKKPVPFQHPPSAALIEVPGTHKYFSPQLVKSIRKKDVNFDNCDGDKDNLENVLDNGTTNPYSTSRTGRQGGNPEVQAENEMFPRQVRQLGNRRHGHRMSSMSA
jgi:hypothetical protein